MKYDRNSMENIWSRAEELLAEGKSFVLATIIRTRGSVPREVGAKMVVPPQGQPFGTIGGGCGEGEVLRRAYPLFDQKVPNRIVTVDLTGDFEQDQIQVCGGLMDVALDLWQPEQHKDLVHALAEAARERRPAALITAIETGAGLEAGAKTCLTLGHDGAILRPTLPLDESLIETFTASVSAGTSGLFSAKPQGQIFVDVQPGIQTLLIVGAGHIAQPLCEMGHMLGFRTVVIDDRWAFANRERFPNATEVKVGPFVETLDNLEINEQTFAVVVTRGHNWDEASVRTILKRKTAYLGMIGSKRRAKATLERLADSFHPEQLATIHTPMGLDIGAESPAEIALAICAEIVKVRHRRVGEAVSLAAKARPAGQFKFVTGIVV
jgi:xanthine dehydrogenase accessory factor